MIPVTCSEVNKDCTSQTTNHNRTPPGERQLDIREEEEDEEEDEEEEKEEEEEEEEEEKEEEEKEEEEEEEDTWCGHYVTLLARVTPMPCCPLSHFSDSILAQAGGPHPP